METLNKCYCLDGKSPVKAKSAYEYLLWLKIQGKVIHVGKINLLPGIFISTAFLGYDHSMPGEKRPILFETMIFCEDKRMKRFFEDVIEVPYRCTTYTEAIYNHRIACRKLLKIAPVIMRPYYWIMFFVKNYGLVKEEGMSWKTFSSNFYNSYGYYPKKSNYLKRFND